MVTNREFRALGLKAVQVPEADAAKTNSQPVVLPSKGQSEQHRAKLLKEGGKQVRSKTKAAYILEELMEIL